MRNSINAILDHVSEAAHNVEDSNTEALIVQIKHKLATIPDSLFIAAEKLYDATVRDTVEADPAGPSVEETTLPNE